MTKRIALLAGITLIAVLGSAPDAMANHCLRCRWFAFEQEFDCVPALGTSPGFPICQTDGITCQTSGTRCATHTASVAPLSSEFAVASVERVDEPAGGEGRTLVAETRPAESLTR